MFMFGGRGCSSLECTQKAQEVLIHLIFTVFMNLGKLLFPCKESLGII